MDTLSTEDRDSHLQAISSLTDVSISHLDVDDFLEELLGRVSQLLETDTAAVLLLDEPSQRLVARAARGLEEEVRQGVTVPVGSGFAGRIAAEGRPVSIDRVDPTTVANPILWEKGVRAMLGVPLQAGTRVIGVLHVGSLQDRVFTARDTELLQLVAERATAAIQFREFEIERAASRVLQRSLLPSVPPRVPGLEIATRYVPAQQGGVGGDWYDAFQLESGTVWLMVGDIVGHGLPAAVVMGRVRSALRSYSIESDDPATVLARANHKIHFFEPDRTATVMCAASDPPYDEFRIALAGHPPPVLATPGEESVVVPIRPGPPLGVGKVLTATTVRVPFPIGATLVAYTDGLVERRDQDLGDRIERLRRSVVSVDSEVLCRIVMESLVGRDIPQDDIALMVVRRLGEPPSTH